MASFIPKIFLLFLVMISITTATANDFISVICPKTKYPTECNRILQSNPEAQQADSLPRLGEICMNLGINEATKVVNEISRLLAGRDLQERRKHAICRTDYVQAFHSMVKAKNRFMRNELDLAIEHAGVATRTPSACGMLFARGREPPDLKRINDEADHVFSIPVTIAEEMHRSGGN